ncbi:hypothetical protein GCM10009610_48120 [Pseudonocardia xinjiangensis]
MRTRSASTHYGVSAALLLRVLGIGSGPSGLSRPRTDPVLPAGASTSKNTGEPAVRHALRELVRLPLVVYEWIRTSAGLSWGPAETWNASPCVAAAVLVHILHTVWLVVQN